MNTTPNDILAGVFAWGYGDIDDLCKQFDAFEVDPCDVGERLEKNSYVNSLDQLTSANGVNMIHDAIFDVALNNAGFDWNEHDERTDRFLNCLDSHLYINDEEVYNFDELKAAVRNLDIYYQPELRDEQWGNDLFSFEVYRSKKRAQADFPGHKIIEYRGDDIEDHTYID